MQSAADVLLGEHDFSAFRAAECQSKTPVRRIESLRLSRSGDYVWAGVVANAFLHHMVRNIVGTLLNVQSAADPAAAMRAILESRDRRRAGMTAPPEGLYLWHISYAERHGIPAAEGGLLLRPSG